MVKPMVIIVAILTLTLLFLAWVIFSPIRLIIDTRQGRYELSQTGTVKMTFHPFETPRLRLRIVGFRVDSFKKGVAAKNKSRNEKPARVRTTSRVRTRSPEAWFFLLKNVLKSIRLTRLSGTVDLDDPVLNAQLIPVMLLIRGEHVQFNTNFVGQYYLSLNMEVRPNKLLWAFIRFSTKK